VFQILLVFDFQKNLCVQLDSYTSKKVLLGVKTVSRIAIESAKIFIKYVREEDQESCR